MAPVRMLVSAIALIMAHQVVYAQDFNRHPGDFGREDGGVMGRLDERGGGDPGHGPGHGGPGHGGPGGPGGPGWGPGPGPGHGPGPGPGHGPGPGPGHGPGPGPGHGPGPGPGHGPGPGPGHGPGPGPGHGPGPGPGHGPGPGPGHGPGPGPGHGPGPGPGHGYPPPPPPPPHHGGPGHGYPPPPPPPPPHHGGPDYPGYPGNPGYPSYPPPPPPPTPYEPVMDRQEVYVGRYMQQERLNLSNFLSNNVEVQSVEVWTNNSYYNNDALVNLIIGYETQDSKYCSSSSVFSLFPRYGTRVDQWNNVMLLDVSGTLFVDRIVINFRRL